MFLRDHMLHVFGNVPVLGCQFLGEGKGRGELASDREGSVTCHMGTQFCFRVYVLVFQLVSRANRPVQIRQLKGAKGGGTDWCWLARLLCEDVDGGGDGF
ncbi:uncharacterized protein E5676_scaffold73G00570 [Cucumis melo var. makuwa]|uniref:Uncharacterized protein n=1 Tax=Cucumis melo var. makuwa TaxID=1194695 RepID=A0A5D3CGZ3_CUCMM|nr:uncharacterized protein E5676_scaffold73G00570 [Cucumis melo var. makuwa]